MTATLFLAYWIVFAVATGIVTVVHERRGRR